jgi:hypothetical protein
MGLRADKLHKRSGPSEATVGSGYQYTVDTDTGDMHTLLYQAGASLCGETKEKRGCLAAAALISSISRRSHEGFGFRLSTMMMTTKRLLAVSVRLLPSAAMEELHEEERLGPSVHLLHAQQ